MVFAFRLQSEKCAAIDVSLRRGTPDAAGVTRSMVSAGTPDMAKWKSCGPGPPVAMAWVPSGEIQTFWAPGTVTSTRRS